jgi:hypothetical protein
LCYLAAFAAQTRRISGQSPIVYTAASWRRQCAGDSMALRSDPLWVAAYDTSHLEMPAGRRSWTFWQYRKAPHVSGISYRGGDDLGYASNFFATLTGHHGHHRKQRKTAICGIVSAWDKPPCWRHCPSRKRSPSALGCLARNARHRQ